MDARTHLRCEATSAACARRFVADVLLNLGFADGLIERATLLTSEIVTNSLIHANSELDLVVFADNPMARVEVYDADPSPPVAVSTDEETIRGLALRVIDALADAWGADQLCVWFEVRA